MRKYWINRPTRIWFIWNQNYKWNKDTELFHLINFIKLIESINYDDLSETSKYLITSNGGVSKLRSSVHFFTNLFITNNKNEMDQFIEKHKNENDYLVSHFQYLEIILETNYIEGISKEIKSGIRNLLENKEFLFRQKLL